MLYYVILSNTLSITSLSKCSAFDKYVLCNLDNDEELSAVSTELLKHNTAPKYVLKYLINELKWELVIALGNYFPCNERLKITDPLVRCRKDSLVLKLNHSDVAKALTLLSKLLIKLDVSHPKFKLFKSRRNYFIRILSSDASLRMLRVIQELLIKEGAQVTIECLYRSTSKTCLSDLNIENVLMSLGVVGV